MEAAISEYSSHLAISIGPSTFQLQDYSVRDAAIMDGEEESGRDVTLEGRGYITDTTLAAFSTALKGARTAFNGSGLDVRITSPGGVEFELLAAQCIGGGPFVDVQVEEQEKAAARHKLVSFTVRGKTASAAASDPENPGGSVTYHLSTDLKPDGLRKVDISGEIKGPNVDVRWGTLVTAFDRQYPWPDWVVTSRFDRERDKASISYVAEELASPLPAAPAGANVQVMDGVASQTRERDEQHRLTVTWAYDLLLTAPGMDLVATLRPANEVILRETVELSSIREYRLRATFTVLRSADGNGLLNYEESATYTKEAATGRVEIYEGLVGLVIYSAAVSHRVEITGRAVFLNQFMAEPVPPDFDGYVLAEPPQVTLRPINDMERETMWKYTLVGTRAIGGRGAAALKDWLGRP